MTDAPNIYFIGTRIAVLEGKLGEKWRGEVCRYCGARASRLSHTMPREKDLIEEWQCAECGTVDQRIRKPG